MRRTFEAHTELAGQGKSKSPRACEPSGCFVSCTSFLTHYDLFVVRRFLTDADFDSISLDLVKKYFVTTRNAVANSSRCRILGERLCKIPGETCLGGGVYDFVCGVAVNPFFLSKSCDRSTGYPRLASEPLKRPFFAVLQKIDQMIAGNVVFFY